MTLPRILTLTGFDDLTNLDKMADISSLYPNVEWAVLFSPSQHGVGRYPSMAAVKRLLDFNAYAGMKLSAHLCGGYSRCLIEAGQLPADVEDIVHGEHFARIQVNTIDPNVSPPRLGNWAIQRDSRAIIQTRNSTVFPGDESVDWLFDQSGGRGITAETWPIEAAPGRLCGYAGGIGPDNIESVIASIERGGASAYWLDMETSLRSKDDRFDIGRCFEVCRLVYGGIF